MGSRPFCLVLVVGLWDGTYWGAFQITSSLNLTACHCHLSKYLETDTDDRPAPIIISPNQLVITPDKGPGHTLSGLIQKVDHDILTNQIDKPQFFPRAPRKPRCRPVLGDQKGS